MFTFAFFGNRFYPLLFHSRKAVPHEQEKQRDYIIKGSKKNSE